MTVQELADKLRKFNVDFRDIAWLLWQPTVERAILDACEERLGVVMRLVAPEAWEKYLLIQGPALAEYERLEGATLAEYLHTYNAAWAKYHCINGPALAEYEIIRDAALAEYLRTCDAPRAEYERTYNAARMELLLVLESL